MLKQWKLKRTENDLMDDEVFDQLQNEITNEGGDCR